MRLLCWLQIVYCSKFLVGAIVVLFDHFLFTLTTRYSVIQVRTKQILLELYTNIGEKLLMTVETKLLMLRHHFSLYFLYFLRHHLHLLLTSFWLIYTNCYAVHSMLYCNKHDSLWSLSCLSFFEKKTVSCDKLFCNTFFLFNLHANHIHCSFLIRKGENKSARTTRKQVNHLWKTYIHWSSYICYSEATHGIFIQQCWCFACSQIVRTILLYIFMIKKKRNRNKNVES